MGQTTTIEKSIPEALLWLYDAPMFIDTEYVDRFYDAVVRPAHSEGETKYQVSEDIMKKAGGKLGTKVSFGLGPLFSFLGIGSANAEMSGEISDEKSKNKGKLHEVILKPITTPQRQLVQLTAHYLLAYPERFFYVADINARGAADGQQWWEAGVISRVPRALAFVNLPSLKEAVDSKTARTMLIPIAAEFTNGTVVTYFDKVKAKKTNSPMPTHPDFDNSPDYDGEKKVYWKWYMDNFEIQQSINLIEQSVQEQKCRIQWIDFRVPISNDGSTMHLHMLGSGKADTINFAYNLIRRGYEYGIRVIGLLKSGPDLNVLSIYER